MALDNCSSATNRVCVWDGTTFCPFESVVRLAELLGNPQDKVKAIHVAGTNGKGSTCATIAAMLITSGYRVGQFASPHLSHQTERCLINGRPVSVDEFIAATERVEKLAKSEEIELSFFVLTALSTFLIFAENKLDWMVIETGLGGRLDATNTIAKPELTLVTNIGFDHMHWLGDTLEAIAVEKAGIGKA